MTLPIRTLRLLLAAAALLACAHPSRAAAQDAEPAAAARDTLYEVRLADGSVLYGRVRDEGAAVTVETQGGATVRLRREQIASMAPLRGRVVRGRVWPADPNATRLFFAPTARSVGAGHGYLGVYEIFFPFLTFGVTDWLTLSGGTPLIPDVIGRVFYVAPKLTVVQTERFSAAAGVLYGADREEGIGLGYGVGTFGDADRALTVGVGWRFDGDVGTDRLMAMVGGERRMGRGTKLITENYLVQGSSEAYVSGGIRFFGERLSADLGFAAPFGEDDCRGGCFFPVVNFVYSF